MLTGLKIDISYIAENVLTYIFMYQFCLSLLWTSLFVVSSLQPFQYLFGLATWPSNKISRKSLLLAFQNPNASLDTDAAETTEMSSAVGDSSDCNYRYHRERKKLLQSFACWKISWEVFILSKNRDFFSSLFLKY